MATDQNQTLVRRFFDEVCNQRNLSLANELFADNHIYHDPQAPTGPGPEGMKQVISTYQTAYPNAHWEVVETISAGNKIVTRWKGSGTQQKELMGIQPTGKSVEVEGIWIHRIENNNIKVHFAFFVAEAVNHYSGIKELTTNLCLQIAYTSFLIVLFQIIFQKRSRFRQV